MLINILRDMEAKHLKSTTIINSANHENTIRSSFIPPEESSRTVQKTRHDRPPKGISFNRRMHLILQWRTLPTKEQKMKQEESRELRNLSINQLKAKLSELYKELPRRNPKYSFERPYRNHLLRQINQIKFEQTLRRKGLRSQGVFITLNK